MDVKAGAAGATAASAQRRRFDRDERARIRDTLIAYMERSAIGVPTLQKEIAIANDVVLDRIPLSTLQRFLADSHRTNDSFIGFCEALARTLPVADPLGDLTRSLAGMFEGASGASEAALPAGTLTGYYAHKSRRQVKGIAVMEKGPATFSPYCRLTVAQSATGPVVRLHEQIIDWKKESGKDKAEPVARPCEGVGLVCGERFFALLKNQLTGAPRTYWMEPRQGWAIAGDIIEMPAALDGTGASELHRSITVGFTQEGEQKGEEGADHAGS